MNRRNFAALAAASAAACAMSEAGFGRQQPAAHVSTEADVNQAMQLAMTKGPRLQIAMLVYPEFTALDLIGPHTFLGGLMNASVHLVWKDRSPVPLDRGGTALLPTTTLAECPRNLDVLFVPGGLKGTIAVMQDEVVLDFLADRGSRAKFVTSVCTGSLVLGCAGLLNGYRATSHWLVRDILPSLGAIPVAERVVEDRNRITGAGVTSGMDFGLMLAAKLSSKTFAEMLQLINEYDPQPPLRAGSPSQAGAALTGHLRQMMASGNERLRLAAEGSRKRWAG
jgi:cyclohexyl-isocyanide hydratase